MIGFDADLRVTNSSCALGGGMNIGLSIARRQQEVLFGALPIHDAFFVRVEFEIPAERIGICAPKAMAPPTTSPSIRMHRCQMPTPPSAVMTAIVQTTSARAARAIEELLHPVGHETPDDESHDHLGDDQAPTRSGVRN